MEEDVGRPEVLMINRYVRLLAANGNIASALGFLALLWSTVVLLGGFIDDLLLKEFWVLTALSFLMACRMAEITNNELRKGIYMEEDEIIDTLRQQKWFEAHKVVIVLRVVQVLKWIFIVCFILLYLVSPFVNLGIAMWRLVRRHYGDAGGDIGNRSKLNAALDIFYVLILFQSLFAFYCIAIDLVENILKSRTEKHCGLEERRKGIVWRYASETARKFRKDGELPGNWNLIAYGVEKLESASGDDHLWGARVLDQLFSKDKSVRQELLSSRSCIQNLIGMIGRRGTADNVENRERAARIVAHLASDLNIAHFPGTLQCICSLLESCNTQSCEPQATDPSEEPEDQNGADTVLQIKDQTEYESGGPKELVSQGLLILEGLTQDEENCAEISKHPRLLSKITSPLLISQGLQILERLTQDEENCTEITKHPRLLSKITSTVSSHNFLSNTRDNTMVEMLSRSLTVVNRLLTSPGDGATRLRQEMAGNKEAVSNLVAILETDSEGAQELHEQVLEVLAELAFDGSFTKPAFGESECMLDKLFKTLQRIFLEEKDGNAVVGEADREKDTRLRGKAGEALARLLPVRAARDANNVAGILSKQEEINLLTKVFDHITATGATIGANNERQSDERNLLAAMLSLVVVICNEHIISREDFVRAIHEDAALVKKLAQVLKVNKQCTAECLRVAKLTCQVVIAMVQAKPSFVQDFNEHNFKEELTEALEIMSEVDGCMLFASLVKEAHKLLNSAQEHGVRPTEFH
ncbi:hypothetical protein SETIT_2G013200v2 [Setaria italica]|uniref:DUF4220 domain-containing protein n=1 Tax=Setaria italica TaxID=4555 RepID=A0A368PUC4_SETIT|nr:uncharacterized protein LOC101754155 [Setaria italica]RCV09262.1 hypothetical protein SETIT_2G013200v2 [Setaria italica]